MFKYLLILFCYCHFVKHWCFILIVTNVTYNCIHLLCLVTMQLQGAFQFPHRTKSLHNYALVIPTACCWKLHSCCFICKHLSALWLCLSLSQVMKFADSWVQKVEWAINCFVYIRCLLQGVSIWGNKVRFMCETFLWSFAVSKKCYWYIATKL